MAYSPRYYIAPHPGSNSPCHWIFDEAELDEYELEEAQQQVEVLLSNAQLAAVHGLTKEDLVEKFSYVFPDAADREKFADTIANWNWAIQNIDALLDSMLTDKLIVCMVPEGKDKLAKREKDECSVCSKNKKQLAAPCGHLIYCYACAGNLVEAKGPLGVPCLVCGKPITSPFVKICC